MRTGLTCKEIAEVLGIQPSKATQSADPAFRKVAGLLLVYPLKTWTEIELAMRRLVREAEEEEIELECLRARGLADLPTTALARRANGRRLARTARRTPIRRRSSAGKAELVRS